MAGRYVHRHLVTFDETNVVGNVYFAHYVRWQGHCRERFLLDRAPGVLALLAHDFVLVTVDCAVEFYAEGFAGDEIEVRMELDRMTGNRVAMAFDYVRCRDGREELLARGRQSIACMRRAAHGLEPAPVPDELRAALAPFDPARTPAGR
jgi:enediyne biosynthesis thioesterase